MVYFLTAIGLTAGGSSTVHIYTQSIHITTQSKQYIEQRKIWEECRRVPAGMMKTECTEQNIHNNKNT
jgi:hypothetical protein